MMSRKTLGILALVLIALAALSYTTSQRRYATTEGGGFVEILPAGIDPGSISSVKAWLGTAPEDEIELQRSSDGWIVASRWGWKAKDDLVQRLLDDLGGLTGELRSSTEEVLSDYQIDDETGLHVLGFGDGGSEMFHLVVGKAATRGGTFVRRDGVHDVFLSSASLRSSFGIWGEEPKPPDAKRWIELRIHKAERNDVDRVVLRDGEQEIRLEKVFEEPEEEDAEVDRTKWTWKPDTAGEFDKNKADGIVSTLCNLYANDVVEPGDDERYGLGEGARRAEITFVDGTVTSVFFGDTKEEDDKFVYFRVGEDGNPAQIYKSTVDRVFPGRAELKPTEG
jgi:hypothetical protein